MDINLIFLVLAGVALFLYSIESFSREVQVVARSRFKKLLAMATDNRFKATFLGAVVTSIIQSSTATTVITVGLVSAGVLTFTQSIGIVFGANIGTTLTAQLVSLKLTYFAPIFIVIGFLISLFAHSKIRIIGKPIFYFGLVFFSLNFISGLLAPLNNDPVILGIIGFSSNIFLGIIAGFILVNIFQSSSVVTGLIIIFAQSNLITLPQGLFLILGSNIGTTTTSLIASIRMGANARKAALSHFLFNLLGVIILLPFIPWFLRLISLTSQNVPQLIANAHTIFNVAIAIVFLIFFNQFKRLVEIIYSKIFRQ